MFVDRIKGPRCKKCGETMALRIIEPERTGFDSRTFECQKCFVTETLVVSIGGEVGDPMRKETFLGKVSAGTG
jgi:hypothetical protein